MLPPQNKIAEKFLDDYQRLKEFHEVAPEGITVIDVTTLQFVDFNQKALELLKLSHDQMLESGPFSLSPEFQPDGRRSDEKAIDLISRALNGERPVFEWLVKMGNGELSFFDVRLAKLSAKGGNERIYVSFVDIMDRKRAENQINLQSMRLSEIGYLQSHQVRQPVANILGLVSLFNHNDLNDPVNSELIKKIELATQQFDTIIKDIVAQTKKIETLTLGCQNSTNGNPCEPGPQCYSQNGCFPEKRS